MKKLIALLLVLVLVCTVFTACGPGKDTTQALGRIEAAGEIIVGVSPDYPPFAFIDTNNLEDASLKYAGIDMRLMEYIASELGVKLVVKAVNFEDMLVSAQGGSYDLVISGLAPDSSRTYLTYSDPYYMAGEVGILICTEDASDLSTISDLEGVYVGVLQEMLTVQQESKLGDARLSYMSTVDAGISRLENGGLDAFVLPMTTAQMYAQQNSDFTVMNVSLGGDENPIVVGIVNNKDENGTEELELRINEIIAQAQEEGLIDQWLQDAIKAAAQINVQNQNNEE